MARKKQGFLHGSIILMLSMAVVKLVGAYFKIRLTHILGGTGMGYFSSGYGLFGPVFALTAAGIPAAVAKLTAEFSARGEFQALRKLKRIALLVSIGAGVVGTAIVFGFARPFVDQVVHNPSAYFAVLAMAPGIFLCCVAAIYHGYFEGLRNMYPTAVSHIFESVVKALAGLLASQAVLEAALRQFAAGGAVFGHTVHTLEQATAAALPYASAAAVGGVTLSCLAEMGYLMLRLRLGGDGITKREIASSPEAPRKRVLLSRLVKLAVPVSIGAIVLNIASLVDLVTIMRRLGDAVREAPAYFLDRYGSALGEDGLAGLPNFLYGSYTGLAVTIFNFIPAIAGMFGKSALPNLTTAWAVGDKPAVAMNIRRVLRATALLAVPAGLGITALARPILALLYQGRAAEIDAASAPLAVMGVCSIALALVSPLFAMLQAVGRADIPVKIMTVGMVLKFAGNWWLVGIPGVDLMGATIATTACYGFILIGSFIALCHVTGVHPSLRKTFGKPLLAGAACAVFAWAGNGLLVHVLDSAVRVLPAIAGGGVMYVAVLFATGGVEWAEVTAILRRFGWGKAKE